MQDSPIIQILFLVTILLTFFIIKTLEIIKYIAKNVKHENNKKVKRFLHQGLCFY